MAKKETTETGTIKNSTALLISLITLGIGFLGGVVFSAYKSGSGVPIPQAAPQQQASQEQQITEDQAKRILALEKEVAAAPNNTDTWMRLGNLYFDTDNYESAIRTYEKSLSLNPNNANVQTDLGVMYRRNGQPKKAVEAFDRAIKIDPKHEVSRFNKGIVLLHDLSDKEGALRAWEELIAVNPVAMTPSGQPLKDLLKRFKETPDAG
jgi:cytochrome c-type biogenesis protein CcmH/NrfG